MAIDPPGLTRRQISAFVNGDQEAVRAIERLFAVSGVETPGDITAITQQVADLSLAAAALNAALRGLEDAVYKHDKGLSITPYMFESSPVVALGLEPFKE